jgi:hypothetical protein
MAMAMEIVSTHVHAAIIIMMAMIDPIIASMVNILSRAPLMRFLMPKFLPRRNIKSLTILSRNIEMVILRMPLLLKSPNFPGRN